MKNFTLLSLTVCLLLASFTSLAQQRKQPHICSTMEYMEQDIKNDPSLPEKWRIEGEKQYKAYLNASKGKTPKCRPSGTLGTEIIIPVVFHIIDVATAQSWITDRDIYQQVELLNENFSGRKAGKYKGLIPDEIFNRVGKIPLKFVLARRSPSGTLTTGIERRVNTTPDYPNNKSFANGGLDAWDVTKYLNVWAGTFTNGLLGIATFPFTTSGGPQGVTIGTSTIAYTSPSARTLAVGAGTPSYYPNYSEGSTLSHEIGHYLYMWHTFGDNPVCNNDDFRIQGGWPLPIGAGRDGDDTPDEKGNSSLSLIFGNPSQNYSDGCFTGGSYGMAYGSFMNYFDDRALFMFTDGQRKRAEGCINLYRPGLLTSDGATPPTAVTDAYLLKVSPWGTPERKVYLTNNSPLTATVRNSGTSNLTSVKVNVRIDAGALVSTTFPINLAPGSDTLLNLAPIATTAGVHTATIYTSSPNGGVDNFSNNDSIRSLLQVSTNSIVAPFSQNFTDTTFPPVGWQIWNPNGGANNTWGRAGVSGFTAAGAAVMGNFRIAEQGTLDDLITPAIDFGLADSSALDFYVAYRSPNAIDVSSWDGLELYVSGDGGVNYKMVYKKSGEAMKTVPVAARTSGWTAPPTNPERWRKESINLTPYIVPGQKMFIKFRNTNANGNNMLVDDINVSAFRLLQRDIFPAKFLNLSDFLCQGASLSPSVKLVNQGTDAITSAKINYSIDNGAVVTINWTGTLASRSGQQDVSLGSIALPAPGIHTIKLFTSLPNGLGDGNLLNDTLSFSFTVIPQIAGSIKETFEGNTFPPANWTLQSFDNPITWKRTTAAAQAGLASMVINNKSSTTAKALNKFISPSVDLSNPDSSFVSFDYSYKQGQQYPGSTVFPLDTLELVVTNDCGVTTTTVWKKWGSDLQTESDPNYANNDLYTPLRKAQWKNAIVYLSPIVTGVAAFQVYFISKGNKQNNLYIDNINVFGKTLPQKLKDQGYLIYPNPFNGSFLIHHLQAPVDLQFAQVFNAAGQLVWDKRYNGNADGQINVNLKDMASGVYVLKMVYSNKTVVERIVKN